MPVINERLGEVEIQEELGARLKMSRLGKNLSIDLLSDQTGLNRKTIMDIEAGKDARISTLLKYSRAVGLLSALGAAFPDELPEGVGLSSRGTPRVKASYYVRKKKNG